MFSICNLVLGPVTSFSLAYYGSSSLQLLTSLDLVVIFGIVCRIDYKIIVRSSLFR